VTHFEWTSERDAMLSALQVINVVMLDNQDLIEETAFAEVELVKRRLEAPNSISREELVDFLKQATIDFNTMNAKG
jgi:hypothetical protein